MYIYIERQKKEIKNHDQVSIGLFHRAPFLLLFVPLLFSFLIQTLQQASADINSRPFSSVRRRDRPAWQRKESLHYEPCKEKRDGFLRRRGRGLIDSASILAAKTHEEIILVIGGQGFIFDDRGYRIPISNDSTLMEVAKEIWI